MTITLTRTGLTAATPAWRWWIALHAGFAAVAVAVLLLPAPAAGWRILALVAAYHAVVVVAARRLGDDHLWRAWTILAPLSVLMVLPDWFLSEVLGVLHFPDNGGPFIGTVPLAMAGMWTIALLPIAGVALAVQQRSGTRGAAAAAGAAGLLVFLAAEAAAPLLGLWQPVGVATVGGVAVYVVGPEVALSICAGLLVCLAPAIPRPATAALTALLPFTYLGLLASSYQFLG